MLSQKCKYALRTIFFLASQVDRKSKIGLKQISEELKIPAPFLGKILQELVRMNFISSSKGPKGGFYLTNQNINTHVLNIIHAIDGASVFNSCGLGLEDCSDSKPCPMHKSYKQVRDELKSKFANKTVGLLASEINENDLSLVR